MEKTVNQKAWFLVLPVLVLVAFSAVIPLMTVVNYSVQDTFGATTSSSGWASTGSRICWPLRPLLVRLWPPAAVFPPSS
jgi:ABC-type sugar transport system permease subunit